MSFSFHPEAEIEFNKSIDYYEEIESGLGYDFALEVYSTIKRSVEFPDAWTVLEGEIRCSLVKTISIRNSVLKRTKGNIHCCSNEPSSSTRILET